MSLLIPPGFGLAAINLTGSQGTAPFVTTLGVNLEFVNGDYIGAANNVLESYGAAMAGATSINLIIDSVTLTVGDANGNGSVTSTADSIPGSSTDANGPMAMSVIAQKVTQRLGRAGRGRMFLPGVNEEAGIGSNGAPLGPYRINIQDRLDLFHEYLTQLVPNPPVPPVLLHSEGSALAPTPIESFRVGPLVGWVRGRIW